MPARRRPRPQRTRRKDTEVQQQVGRTEPAQPKVERPNPANVNLDKNIIGPRTKKIAINTAVGAGAVTAGAGAIAFGGKLLGQGFNDLFAGTGKGLGEGLGGALEISLTGLGEGLGGFGQGTAEGLEALLPIALITGLGFLVFTQVN